MADSTQLPTLYHYPNSRSTKILWLCKEYKIPVNVSAISLPMRENKSSWYLKINPNGTVPTWTIADGSEHITDSAEIMKHVVETNKLKFTGNSKTVFDKWIGTDLGVSAEIHIIEYWHHTVLFPFFMRNAQLAQTSKGHWDSTICKDLKDELGDKQFFGGDEFSPVDCYFGYILKHANSAKLLDTEPTLKAYIQRCSAREGFTASFPAGDGCTIL